MSDANERNTIREETAKELLSNVVTHLVSDDCDWKAVLVLSDGDLVQLLPLRLSAREAFSMLVVACTVLENLASDGDDTNRSLN